MKYLVLLLVLSLGALSIPQVMADPAADLRVITLDPLAAGFDGSIAFSTSPFNGDVYAISDIGDFPNGGEDIAAFDGNVYASDFTRIIRLNLDSSGQPDGGVGNNVDEITGDIFSTELVAITVGSNGIIYAADYDNQIYTVDPSGTLPVGKFLVNIDQEFVEIRDIVIDGNFLYILDAGADNYSGAIYKVNLSDLSVVSAYSGSLGDEVLSDSTAIAVSGADMFVSGYFSFGPGILKISPSSTSEFGGSSSVLSDPLDLTIDSDGNDLYVTDGSSIFYFSLASIPSHPVLEITDAQFSDPVGLATLTISGSIPDVQLSLSKTVNATQALPGQGLLYTITATNEGPDPATAVLIHDFFPKPGVESFETSPGHLSFTSQVHDVSSGTVSDAGNCARRGTDAYTVDCSGFGTLDAGDYVIVTLKGTIKPGAPQTLTNRAVVENFGKNVQATATTTLVSQLTLTKTASPGTVVAGNGFIDYVVTVRNTNPVTANGVIITDTLPHGVSHLVVNSQPLPASCQVTTGTGGNAILQCGPYNIQNNGGSATIRYRVTVDPDAQGTIMNSVNLSCSNCASIQKSATTTVTRQSDLSISKISNTDSVIPGQDSISYTITVANNGPSVANNVVITDNLPHGVTFKTSGTSPECSYDSGNHVVTCTLANPLLVGVQNALTINVAVNSDASGELVNTASITSSSTDNNQSNNVVEADPISIDAETDVTLAKTGPQSAAAGGTITYNLSVTNSGPSSAVDVSVQDVLPAGLTFIDSTQSGSHTDPDCSSSLGTIVCEFGNVDPGVTQTKSIQVQVDSGVTGDLTNAAEVFSDVDSNFDNNVSQTTTTINPPFCGRPESDFAHVITGTEGNDVLQGTNDDDLIIGLGGNDKIHGKKGNDCIIGGDGDDKIWGGKGDDFIEGDAGNDQIHGQQDDDILKGGDGDDKIWGGQGKDTIDAGSGNNQVHGNQEDDNITAGDGDNKIWGGQGDDIISTGNGNNRINGNQGKDTITTGSGNDWISGGQADDTISAGDGDNKVNGNQGKDTITTGSGNDWISGGQGDDTIHAGAGNDKIFGKQGKDDLFGESGNDMINGAQGNDLLNGGPDNDQCDGGQGHNTFVECESQKPMTDENDDEEDAEDQEDNEENDDNNGHDNNGHDNNGHDKDNGKDKGKKK